MPKARLWPITASGVVGGFASPAKGHAVAVTLKGGIITETAGATNESLIFYAPTPDAEGRIIRPDNTGTVVFELIVPKGTTFPEIHWGEVYFPNGLYVAIAGGTLVGGLIIE